MNREIILQLIGQTPAGQWTEQNIHNNIHHKTRLNSFSDMSYKEIKSNFENTFVDQLKAYNHSTLTGLEEFKHVDSIIGCTQYIDTLYQSQPNLFFIIITP